MLEPFNGEQKANKKIGRGAHSMRRLGVGPDLKIGPVPADMVTTRTAVKLTGLTPEQLREWTIRRSLIPADVKPKGQGSPARYSWQTILLLRLALVLRDGFRLELHAHRELFADMASTFVRTAFRSLWGKALAVHGNQRCRILERDELTGMSEDCIVLRLDPHLTQLAEAFSLPPHTLAEQYELFEGMRAGLQVMTGTGGR
jgi:hypothetical protein